MTPTTYRGSWRFAGLLLAVILGASLSGRGSTSAIGLQGRGDLNRADPCDRLPDPPGLTNGIHERCDIRAGSSSGIAKGDFNGDGIADLAIGIPGKTLTVNQPAGTASHAGAVQIIYGTAADGLQTATYPPQLLTESTILIVPADARAEADDQFGSALAAGDFDHDGFSDLAVGIPGETTSTTSVSGAVAVFMGSAAGLSTSIAAFFGPSVFKPATNAVNTHCAGSLTWGDFNGDGFGDLAVASDYYDFHTQVAAATVLFGSASGLSTQGKVRIELEHMTATNHQTAPLVLSAGDFNKDGFFDLVAGSPQTDFGGLRSVGRVHILPGSGNGPDVIGQLTFDEYSDGVPTDPEPDEQFGAALAVGDFNGDAIDDLAIGVPLETNGPWSSSPPGAVIVIPGSFFGLRAIGTPGAQILVGGGGRFGAALAANAFDADAIKDLAVGSPTKSLMVVMPIAPGVTGTQTIGQAGMVEIIFGTSSGLSRTAGRTPQRFSQSAPTGAFVSPATTELAGMIEAGDRFGSSLTAWNFGRSTRPDLAIGVPFEALGTVAEAGAVQLVYGSSTGLTATGAQLWSENSAGLGTIAAAGDHFGLTVY
jgi:hypothetical protein